MSTKKSAKRHYDLRDLEKGSGPMTVGLLLKAFRECDELSQVEFAQKLGISRANLCDIEKGRTMVSLERAARFAKILGVTEAGVVIMAIHDQLRSAKIKVKLDIRAA